MMKGRRVLGDSNVLIHLTNPRSRWVAAASIAVESLEDRGAVLHYTSQNLAEFWNVCTRIGPGGLGLSIEETAGRVAVIEEHFLFLWETERTDGVFKDLLTRYRVSGVQVHDARLAVVMISNYVDTILTFDRHDFLRYTEIEVLLPDEMARLG